MSTQVLRAGVLGGARYGSSEALAAGIVDAEWAAEELGERAREMAEGLLPPALGLAMFNAGNWSTMKVELYTDAYRALTTGTGGSPPEARL